MITYIAINTLNGKFYIGSTKNFEKRKNGHLKSKDNYPFQRALRKNPDAFVWETFEDDSEERLLEQALLDMWFGKEQCYNLLPEASGAPSVEGKRMWVNNEGVQTFSDSCPGPEWALGVSDERRAQNSRARKGKRDSEETRKKKSLAHRGKKRVFSESHRKNLSASKMGKKGSSKGGLVAGSLNATLGKGFCNPLYRNSEKCKEDRLRASRKGSEATSKPILIVRPCGKEEKYKSLSEAARETGLTGTNLRDLARTGRVGKQGPYSGIKVYFL